MGPLATVLATQSFSLSVAEGFRDKVGLLMNRILAAFYRPLLFLLYSLGYASVRTVCPGFYWLSARFRTQFAECLERLPGVGRYIDSRRKRAYE